MEHLGDPGGVLRGFQARPKGGGKATGRRGRWRTADRSIPGLWQPSRRGLSGPGALPTPGMGGGLGAAAKPVCRKGWPSAPKHNWQEFGRAVAAGVPFAWVTGDTDGNTDGGGGWRNRAGVLAVKNNEPLWADTRGSYPQWPCNAASTVKEWGHWLLVRRSIADEDLAYYACFGTGSWCAWPALGGRLTPSRRPSRRWTSTKCACGSAGTGTSPWRLAEQPGPGRWRW